MDKTYCLRLSYHIQHHCIYPPLYPVAQFKQPGKFPTAHAKAKLSHRDELFTRYFPVHRLVLFIIAIDHKYIVDMGLAKAL